MSDNKELKMLSDTDLTEIIDFELGGTDTDFMSLEYYNNNVLGM